MSQSITNAQVMDAAGISASYASMILKGRRPCPPLVAAKVYQRFGHRMGPLLAATDDEIAAFIKLNGLGHELGDTAAADDVSPGKSEDLTAAQQSEAA